MVDTVVLIICSSATCTSITNIRSGLIHCVKKGNYGLHYSSYCIAKLLSNRLSIIFVLNLYSLLAVMSIIIVDLLCC